MKLSFRIKHHFFSAFRELFVHHHGSLEFRAKIFALIIAANEDVNVESYMIIKEIGMKIYDNDELNFFKPIPKKKEPLSLNK